MTVNQRTLLPWSSLASVGRLKILRVSYFVLAAIPAMQAGIEIWNAQPGVPHFELEWEVRALFLSMLLVSIGNVLFSAFRPRELELDIQTDAAPTRLGLGERVDWTVQLYDLIRGADPPEERTKLITDLVDWRDEQAGCRRGTDNRTWAIASWNQHQASRRPARWLCGICYFLGLTGTVVLLFVRSWRVLVG